MHWALAEPFHQNLGKLAERWRAGREIHFQLISPLFHGQLTAARFKDNDLLGVAKHFEDDMSCRQGCVTAQVNLLDRGEPAQLIALFRGNEESRLG